MKWKSRWVLNRRWLRKTLWIAAGAMMVMSIVGGQFSVTYAPIDENAIIKKLALATENTREISRKWLSATDTGLLGRQWKMSADEMEHQTNDDLVSLFLIENDTIKYWSPNNFRADITPYLLQTNNSILELEGRQVLIFNKQNDSNRIAATVVTLSDINSPKGNIFSKSEFSFHSFQTIPVSVTKRGVWKKIDYQNVSFWVSRQASYTTPLVYKLMCWVAMALLLMLIMSWVRRKTTRENAYYMWAFMFFVLFVLRVAFAVMPVNQGPSIWMSPYLSGWTMYLFSPFNLLVTSLFILVLSLYYYSVRNKLEWISNHSVKWRQVTMWSVSIIVRSASLIYFHWALVENIYSQTVNVTFFRLFSLNAPGALLYVSVGIYMVSRLFQCDLNKIYTPPSKYWGPSVISFVMLFAMVVPLIGKLHGTWPLLLIYSLSFRSLGLFWRRFSPATLLGISVALTAFYFTAITMWESSAVKKQTAQEYMELIVEHQDSKTFIDPPKYDQFSYAFINRYRLKVKSNNKTDLQNIMPYSQIDTVVNIGIYTHLIKPCNDQTIVVSYQDTNIQDWVAMFCYLYLIFFILSICLLRLLGVNIFRKRQFTMRSLAFKIQMMILAIVLFLVISVAVVSINYNLRSSSYARRQVVNNKITTMLTNLNLYQNENRFHSNILLEWYQRSARSLGDDIVLYNIDGLRILDNQNAKAPLLINSDALSKIAYQQAPFFVQREQRGDVRIMMVYMPAYHNKTLTGYIGAMFEDPTDSQVIYPVVEDLLNILVVILVVTLWLSMLLNHIVTKPLEALRTAMSQVGLMRKIPAEFGMDVEIRNLVLQYNKMIDYLEESYVAMARYERESAWQEMARRIAHEIKNPLTPMRLKVQLLQRYRKEGYKNVDQKIDETLNLLLEQIDVIAAIVDEFRDFARMRENNPSIINLCTLLNDVSALYDKYENIEVRFQNECSEPVWVYADGNQISRVIGNLCKNSVEAMANQAGGFVDVTLHKENGMAVVRVSDNGPGISEEIAKRIFEPNFTTKEKGSGLGLVISQQIVENYCGRLYFTAHPCRGTIFTMELPLKT